MDCWWGKIFQVLKYDLSEVTLITAKFFLFIKWSNLCLKGGDRDKQVEWDELHGSLCRQAAKREMLELVCRKSSKVCLCVYISVCLCVSVWTHMCFGIRSPTFSPCPQARFKQCSSVKLLQPETPWHYRKYKLKHTHTLKHKHTCFTGHDLTIKFPHI